jgi:hypothetical protein
MASCAPKRAADQLHGLAIRKLSSFFPFSFSSFFPPFPFLLSSFPFLSLFISLHQNRILAEHTAEDGTMTRVDSPSAP